MLDRFDARWMLDVADFTKGSLNFTGAANAVNSEVSINVSPRMNRYYAIPIGGY